VSVSQGAAIKIHPKLNGIEFNPLTAEIGFYEDWHRIPFRIRASREFLYQGSNGVITITASGVIVAEIPISIYVSDKIDDVRGLGKSMCRAYQSIFCSYSHKDKQIVERIEKAYRALGFDYLRDVTTLRSGERWDDRLIELIDNADLFQLFWSTFSAQSLYVEKEWRHALTLGRENFIRPVRWADPIDPAPPSELQNLHFAYVPELANADR